MSSKSETTTEQPTAVHAELHDAGRSAAGKYKRLVVGDRGFFFLLYYELVTMLFSGCGGALGHLLRSVFYRPMLGSMGKGVVIGRYVTMRHPQKIHLADGAAIGDFVSLDAMGDDHSEIALGEHALVGRNTVLTTKGGRIRLGNRANIGMNCLLIARDCRVAVGADTLLAAYCYLMGGGVHGFDRTDKLITQQHLPSRGVSVGENCWLGAGVKVADGSTIGDGTVVGAGSVVMKDLPSMSVAHGVPAQVSRHRGSVEE